MKAYALVAALTLASCSSPKPSAAPPVPDTLLSILQQDGPDCLWRQVDPLTGTDRLLARVPLPCPKAELGWSPDGRKAELSPSDGTGGLFWEVPLGGKALPGPMPGKVLATEAVSLGYSADSQLVARQVQVRAETPGMWARIRSWLGQSPGSGEEVVLTDRQFAGTTWRLLRQNRHGLDDPDVASWIVKQRPEIKGTTAVHVAAHMPRFEIRNSLSKLEGPLGDGMVPQQGDDWYTVNGCRERVLWNRPLHRLVAGHGNALGKRLTGADAGIGSLDCRGKYLLFNAGADRVELWDLETVRAVLDSSGTFADFWPGPQAP